VPTGAHQECRNSRCPRYAVRNGLCKECHAAIQQRLSGNGLGLRPNNRRFLWMRRAFLNEHPICTTPGCNQPATVLDHVEPHRGDAGLFWNQRNWQGLCVHCHGVKSIRESQSRM
jgi:5-methylcytosine-specific restriction protein A